MVPKFHLLPVNGEKPAKFTNPFDYVPDRLSLAAAADVAAYIEGDGVLRADADRGKMFGVLVVDDGDGRTGYLAAYSGLLAGRNDHAFFVPPVFDAMRPDGYFKTHEAEITALNRRIDGILHSDGYATAVAERDRMLRENGETENAFRQKMKEAKAKRDARRCSPSAVTAEEEAEMTRESQFMKAELRRIRQKGRAAVAAVEAELDGITAELERLKGLRKSMSDSLQRWLFSQYSMLNARGERRDLVSIFAETAQRVPPSGAGDCCAPKLLQYAYLNGLRPISMAEFWWGESPKHEVRHHKRFYPACRGKCLPILTHMLQGLDVESGGRGAAVCRPLEIVYEDEWLAVVDKPAGLPTVPGLAHDDSVWQTMRQRSSNPDETMPVHRLDMDTSGLVVVAFDAATYKALQALFANREVRKRYVALLDGVIGKPVHGEIDIPLRPDPLDRPYQKVDYAAGKPAKTEYQVIGTQDGKTRVALFPHTGRTHQLRVHCAHADGLGVPIVGDRLYGHAADRLCLHAEAITFTHPVTGRRMTFERKAEF